MQLRAGQCQRQQRQREVRGPRPAHRGKLHHPLHRDQQEQPLRLLHPGHPLGHRPARRHRGPGLRQQRRLDRLQHRRQGPPGPRRGVQPPVRLQPARQPTHRGRAVLQGRRQDLRLRQPQHRRHPPRRQKPRPHRPTSATATSATTSHPRAEAPYPRLREPRHRRVEGHRTRRTRGLDQPAQHQLRHLPRPRGQGSHRSRITADSVRRLLVGPEIEPRLVSVQLLRSCG